MPSSTFDIPVTFNNTPITPETPILQDNITFKPDEFDPGKAALVRVWFSFGTAGDADTVISVTHDGTFSDTQQLNADQLFVIKPKGLYRFDIDALPGDLINIKSSIQITDIFKLRFQKIVIGA